MKIAYFLLWCLPIASRTQSSSPATSISSITAWCVGRRRKRCLAEALSTSLKPVFALSKGERRSDCHPQLIPGHVPTQSDIQRKRQELLASNQNYRFSRQLLVQLSTFHACCSLTWLLPRHSHLPGDPPHKLKIKAAASLQMPLTQLEQKRIKRSYSLIKYKQHKLQEGKLNLLHNFKILLKNQNLLKPPPVL